MKANDRQVGGAHYVGEYQHWDLVADLRLGYFEGQVTKYVSRWRKKNGPQDLEKADHFLCKLIELVTHSYWSSATSAHGGFKGIRADGKREPLHNLLQRYSKANGLSPIEFGVIYRVATWSLLDHLIQARAQLRQLIDNASAMKLRALCEGDEPPSKGYVDQDQEAVWDKLGGAPGTPGN